MKKYENYQNSNISWIKSFPLHWGILRGKYLYKKENRMPSDNDEIVTCFRDGTVTLRKNRRTTGFTESLKEVGYQGIKKGDLIIHVMDAFAGSIGVSDSDGKGTPVYSVCSAIRDINNYYYAYLLREMARTGYIQSLYRGIRERSSDFRFDVFAAQYYIVPPHSEQDQIVRYLDWQTSRINKLINGYKRQIELLEERKRTVTFYSVVYGLNHNIEMKDSIIPWIDHIPAHWSVKNLAQLFTQVKCKNTNLYEKNLLSLSYGKIKRRNIDATGGLLPESFEGYNIIEKDDIVLRLTDLQNDHKSLRTGIATEKGIVTSAYVTIRNFSENNPQYLHYYLHAFDLNKGFYNVGASGVRQSLNWDNIRTLQILLPPLNEQNQIVDYINRASTKIDEIKKTYEKKIELFLEYRTRLISDVVTGQIDVRDIDIPEYVSEEEYNDDLQDNNNDMEGDINE